MKNWIRVLLMFFMSGFFPVAYAETADKAQEAGGKTFEKATFAGGCFWCMEPPFDELEDVISTTSGYAGGQQKKPTYASTHRG